MFIFSSTLCQPKNIHRHKSALIPRHMGILLGSFCFMGGLGFPAATTLAATQEDIQKKPAKFNTSFLLDGGKGVDLSDFLDSNTVVAGSYRVDINVNRNLVGRQDIQFAKSAKSGKVEACLTLSILESLGLNIQKLRDAGALDESAPEQCLDLPGLIEHASVSYDSARQLLSISLPQASILRSAKGYVDPALWDEGVTAGFVDYSFNGRRNTVDGQHRDNYNLGLRNGLNLGAWRLRNNSNFNTDNQRTEFRSDQTFAQRDITALKSQLTLGSAYTDPNTFDSVRIQGAMLVSDDAMLPDSQRGYAPIIHGYAQTNATVEVRQNNYMIYNTNVAPGPFVIDDIYPNGSNGDLEITVIEANGQRQVFTQAYASLPQMIRRGTYRHSLALGRYDGPFSDVSAPTVAAASLTYGLTNDTTISGGVQTAPDFKAINLGAAQNTPIGALALSVTQSTSTVSNETSKGQSARLLYAKTLASTDTTLTLASYRYSTEGYRSLSEHMTDLNYDNRYGPRGRAKSRFDLTLNQTLGDRKYGSLYMTVGEQRYWNLPGKSKQYTVGYSNNWRSLSYNLSATHSLSAVSYNHHNDERDNSNESRIALTLSLPFGDSGNTNVSSTLASDSYGERSVQSGVNGRVMGRDDAFYSVNAGHESLTGQTLNASINGLTPVAQVNLGYGLGSGYKSLSAGVSGSLVAHAGGINLGQPVGDSFILAQVPGVAGTQVGNNARVTTGLNGYAVVPSSQPYRINWVNLDSEQLGADIEIDNPTQQVIPRRGAVTKVHFAVKKGRRVQFELVRADGSAMPFGASVENQQGIQLAVSDPRGHALVLLEEDKGVLKVKSRGQVCEAVYSLPERTHKQGYDRVKLTCQ